MTPLIELTPNTLNDEAWAAYHRHLDRARSYLNRAQNAVPPYPNDTHIHATSLLLLALAETTRALRQLHPSIQVNLGIDEETLDAEAPPPS